MLNKNFQGILTVLIIILAIIWCIMKTNKWPKAVIVFTVIDFYDEDVVQEREFLPLTNVFSCLMSKGHTPEDKSINRQFCGKLLNLVIDELDSDKQHEFYINKRDVVNTIEKLRWSQPEEAPKQ